MIRTTYPRHRTGQQGEDAACKYLQGRGFRIVERNFRCPFGEVDIIARDGETLVFVEVRTGGRGRIHAPEETVSAKKQLKIGRSALFYLQRHGLEDRCAARFDVVAVEQTEKGADIRHIPDAFEIQEG